MNDFKRFSAFTSEVFTIRAGTDGRIFFAHSGFLSKSRTLRDAMDRISRNLKGGCERSIDLTEFEEQPVEQVLEWLYSGQYTWCGFTKLPANADGVPMPHLSGTSFYTSLRQDGQGRSINPAPYASDSEQFSEDYSDGQLTPPSEDFEYIPTLSARTPFDVATCDSQASGVEDVLQCSAQTGCTLLMDSKVLVLAKYLQLYDLQRLAYYNTRDVINSIVSIEVASPMVHNVLEMVRYVYSCTESITSSIEPLRKLVFSLVAEWLPALKGPELDKLLWEGGDFAVDVVRDVENKMSALMAMHEEEKAEMSRRLKW